MAEKTLSSKFGDVFDSLFCSVDRFVSTNTVVGEPMEVDGATIIPLVDVTCGMAAGAFLGDSEKKDGGAGGMSAKISPSALLVIQNGAVRLVNIKLQDPVSKVIDMAPDLVERYITKPHAVSEKAVQAAKDMAKDEKKK